MKFRTRMALHDFGLRSIALAIVLGQAAFAAWVACKLPSPFGPLASIALFAIAASNARGLASWWGNL